MYQDKAGRRSVSSARMRATESEGERA
jgi:hypothetical protein